MTVAPHTTSQLDLRALVDDAADGGAGLYLTFAGQGASWLPELRQCAEDDTVRSVIDTCLDAIDEERGFVDNDIVFPLGLDVPAWLRDANAAPPRRYLSRASVSGPLVFVTQVARLYRLHAAGVAPAELIAASRAVSGLSQGLITACMVALMGGEDEERLLRTFAKVTFYLGARSQEVYPYQDATEEEVELASLGRADREVVPTPMAAVVGVPAEELRARVARFNQKVRAAHRVHVALRLSRDRSVLSGHRRSLIAFHAWNAGYLAWCRATFQYVRTSCPFHCDLMASAAPRMEADLSRIGFRFSGRDLRLPVYSLHDRRNLQYDANIASGLHLDVVVRPLAWSYAIVPALQGGITHVLDFGPGAENRHLIRQSLEAERNGKPVLSARKFSGRPV